MPLAALHWWPPVTHSSPLTAESLPPSLPSLLELELPPRRRPDTSAHAASATSPSAPTPPATSAGSGRPAALVALLGLAGGAAAAAVFEVVFFVFVLAPAAFVLVPLADDGRTAFGAAGASDSAGDDVMLVLMDAPPKCEADSATCACSDNFAGLVSVHHARWTQNLVALLDAITVR